MDIRRVLHPSYRPSSRPKPSSRKKFPTMQEVLSPGLQPLGLEQDTSDSNLVVSKPNPDSMVSGSKQERKSTAGTKSGQKNYSGTALPTATTSQESDVTTCTSLVSEHSLKSLLFQIGMNCQATNSLKEIILQNMDVNMSGGRLLPGDSYPNWLTFSSEGSSVTFEVPQVKGSNLKTMMCIVYTSTPDNVTSSGLENMLLKNYTKATIQLYKSEALVSFEDVEGQRVVSSIEPGNKVEVVVVFENNYIVKKTVVYLVYDEQIGEKREECQAPEENVIVCSGDENECIVRESSQQVELVKENNDASEPKSDRVLDSVVSDSKPDLERGPERDPKSKLKLKPLRIYDVFLSFRGDDTRLSFTSHLHAALQNAGIKVFKDDGSLQIGDDISTSLSHAIEQSRIAIIVFSKNYGNSRWCLNELEKIMKCERTIGLTVVPVFYHVDPSHVRNRSGEFGTAFGSLLNKISNEVELVESWKKALHTAGSIAGFKIPTRNEDEDIKRIVTKVSKLLNNKYLFIADYPVGIKSRVKDMIQPLHFPLNGVKLLGIWGMGGGGKTTIAKAIYNKIGHNFEGRSFLADIREVWKQDGRQMGLQEQLLFDICKEITKISSIDEGKNTLKKTLFHKRVLILLDDVSTQEQLNALGGNREWLGSGSVIIITTRDLHVLTKRVDNIYKMTLMNESESIEFFNWNAFKQASPPTIDFVRLSKNVVEYSGGLPLALEVLGSHLFDKKESEWELVLKKLKKIPNDQVQKKLRISYDGLDDEEREMFLDIACFFIGMARSDVILILNDCGLSAEIGIRVLVERSLVSVDDKNMLGMHDLMREMGRGIIREENPKRPEKRSRLWYQFDVINALSRQTGKKTVMGLTLKLPKHNAKCFSTKAFEKMKRLRFLQLAEVKLDGGFEYVSRELRWLSWNGLSHIPTDFYGENLVSIELENSNFDLLWKRTLRMENLKILNLSHSHCLARSPGFSNMPNLEKLVLTNCPKLCRVSPSIGHLKKILEINLQDCVSLRRLPRSIYKLKSLETLILSGCKMLDKLKQDIEQMESLTHLLANNTAITTIPFSILRSKTMGYISLCGNEGLSRYVFPSIIWSFTPPTSSFSSFSSLFQTSVAMSFIVSLGIHIPHGSSQQLSSIFNRLSLLRSLRVKFGSNLQLSKDANIILYAFYATLSKDLAPSSATSHVSNMKTSSLIKCCGQLPVSGAKDSVNSLLIQMGMSCQVTNNLKENILQNMNENGSGCSLPGDSHPNWLNFNWEGSSVTFNVPLVEGRMLKTIMIYIVYSSTPDIVAFDGLTNLLVKNYTKATIHLFKRGAIAAFEDEEGQRVVSSIEPGNKVEVAVVFEYRFIVKEIKVYLVYGEPIAEKAEECHAQDKNVIVCSGVENEYFVGEASSHAAQDKNEPIVCSGEENEDFFRKVSHAHNKNEPIVCSAEEKEGFGKKVSHAHNKNEPIVCSGEEKEGFVRKVPHAPNKNEPIVCSAEEKEGFVRKVAHAHNTNEPIVCSAEENVGFVRKVAHAHNTNEPIVCSAEEKEGFVRKVSPQVARMDDVLPEIYEFPLMDEEAPNVPLKSEDLIIAASGLQPPPANVVSANEFERFKEEIRNELAAQSAKQEDMDGKLDLLIRLATIFLLFYCINSVIISTF